MSGKRKRKQEQIDYSDIPELTEAELASAKPLGEVFPGLARPGKTRITIRLDDDVLEWFKGQAGGEGYQRMINEALRVYMRERKEPLEDTLRRVLREELARRAAPGSPAV